MSLASFTVAEQVAQVPLAVHEEVPGQRVNEHCSVCSYSISLTPAAVEAFPDRGSALRLVTAVALNVTAIWTDRRYLDMSLLKSKEVERLHPRRVLVEQVAQVGRGVGGGGEGQEHSPASLLSEES